METYLECRDGGLYWLKAPSLGVRVGDRAGSPKANGARMLTFKGKIYQEHRVVWFLLTGAWPERRVVHINGDKADNRFVNLRYAAKSKASKVGEWKARVMIPQPVPVKEY